MKITKKNRKKGLRIKEAFIAILFFIVIFFVVMIIVFSFKINTTNNNSITVREQMFAGKWYPADSETLRKDIEGYYKNSVFIERNENKTLRALIVPHAGYMYSGEVAANAYNQIDKKYSKIIIIATNHASDANVIGIAVSNFSYYKTPFGNVKVSDFSKKLLSDKEQMFEINPKAENSHVIESQLPFLQERLGDNFEILPLITGALFLENTKHAADILSEYIDNDTLIIISTDFSHYHSYHEAVSLDNQCIDNIVNQNIQNTTKCEACGIYAILILEEIAKRNNWTANFIDYRNSGDVTSDKSGGVVGYAAISFYEDKNRKLSEYEKETLLSISKDTLNSIYDNNDNNNDKKAAKTQYYLTEKLNEKKGCFVTLNKDNNLRGCIGYIMPEKSLYECVMENTKNAALNDNRFSPVKKEELNDIDVEISVLSVPKSSDVDSIVFDVDGVILKQGAKSATYLPTVWDYFSSKDDFLKSLCEKGNMASLCWKDSKTEVYTYQAEVFS